MIYKRVFSFLSKNNVLAPQQYGFQKSISTIYAILELLTATYDNINANNYTGILFLDLTKAFDTICHQILLAKLQHYGIRGPSHQLIKSFLERKQFVSINGVNSDLHHNSFGVPQGSTLGPLLFLIYINDLPNAVLGSTTLFADDTCLMLRNSNLFDPTK